MMQLHCTLEKLIGEPYFISSVLVAKACPQELFIGDFDIGNIESMRNATSFQLGMSGFENSITTG